MALGNGTNSTDRVGMFCRYSDVGTSMTWIAKERYVVIDVSSGPVSFGPIGADARAVTSLSVPRLQARNPLRRSHPLSLPIFYPASDLVCRFTGRAAFSAGCAKTQRGVR
jgi:hypothetical protein